MKKIMNWVLAATLFCGASVFTACTNETSDNPPQEPSKKNRKEFVEHTRATMKELAENMNFSTWEATNKFNSHFNKYVVANPEFSKAVFACFLMNLGQTIKEVEEGSELAQMGYKQYGTVDLSTFNYRFTMTADNTGFDFEPADNFEIVMNGINPRTHQMELSIHKLSMKCYGVSTMVVVSAPKMEDVAFVILVPSAFHYTMSTNLSGIWHENFSGDMYFQLPTGETGLSKGFAVDVTLNSDILSSLFGGKDDKTQLTFSFNNDRVNKTNFSQLTFVQNGRNMLDLSLKESSDGAISLRTLDLSKIDTSASIFDLLGVLLTSRHLDEGNLTLLDDLTTTISISDIGQLLLVAHANATARRNYASKETIDQYTDQMNALMTCTMTCNGMENSIPVRMVTTKFGVDWWTMPALNFADENGFVPFTELLDAETVQYAINVLDHSAEPLQESLISIRQLILYVVKLVNGFKQEQDGAQDEGLDGAQVVDVE